MFSSTIQIVCCVHNCQQPPDDAILWDSYWNMTLVFYAFVFYIAGLLLFNLDLYVWIHWLLEVVILLLDFALLDCSVNQYVLMNCQFDVTVLFVRTWVIYPRQGLQIGLLVNTIIVQLISSANGPFKNNLIFCIYLLIIFQMQFIK